MLIGVELTTTNVGELFADARALEGAGADSLWSAGGDDDPFIFLAALAPVTYRVRLVALDARSGEAQRATLERLSRGRLVLATSALDPGSSILVASGNAEALARAVADANVREEGMECWARASLPPNRAEWNELRAGYERVGVTGIVVPNDPRLIDILRNPDVVEDRSDIKLAFG
jgi:hypothetical protein